jgi:hypothetical protein
MSSLVIVLLLTPTMREVARMPLVDEAPDDGAKGLGA